MTEPQTIATALSAQLIINRVFRDQYKLRARVPKKQPPRKPEKKIKLMGIDDMEKYQVIYDDIYIIAPFVITGLDSLHNHIIEKGTTSPEVREALKQIKAIALKNISLFETLPTSFDENSFDIVCYKYYERRKISRLHNKSGNYEGERYTNYELFEYCHDVQALLNFLPQDAPVKNFIDHLVMDENKKQQFADHLKSKYSDLTGKDLAIMFYAAKEYIKLRNLKALLEAWQQFIDRDIKRDEAMSKAMRTLKNFPLYYAKELNIKQAEIQTIYKSIE